MGAQHARRVSPETGAVAPTREAVALKDVEIGLSSPEQASSTEPAAAPLPSQAAALSDDAEAPTAAPATGGRTSRDVAALRKLYANPMYRAPNPSFEQRKAAQSRWRRRPVNTVQDGESA